MGRAVALLAAPATLAVCAVVGCGWGADPPREADLDAWVAAERRVAIVRILLNVSPTGTFHRQVDAKYVAADRWAHVRAESRRPGGRLSLRGDVIRQTIVPVPGAVVAAPFATPPEPDYFFHWVRDSALVMGELARVASRSTGNDRQDLLRRWDDFVEFTRALQKSPSPAGLGEVRVNADGSPDFLKWSRPQFDGPALRALALMAAERLGLAPSGGALGDAVQADLDYVAAADREGFDLWEEYKGHDYYARSVQAAALDEGARRERSAGGSDRARAYEGARDARREALEAHWLPDRGCYSFADGPRVYWDGSARPKPGGNLDAAVLLAAIHGGRSDGRHSVLDDRILSCATVIEDMFAAEYPINRGRPLDRGVAFGRYLGDDYFGGNPWVFVTLGVAELHYRVADCLARRRTYHATELSRGFLERALLRIGSHRTLAPGVDVLADAVLRRALLRGLIERGDDFVRTIRRATPASGLLAEQFDKTNGSPASGHDLSWSYASFLSATDAREDARRSLVGP